ncbi:hypothetical protein [Kutzneria sp. NPDC051319]|uniref:hypothetical protein n=1 Tax=Kutzneria sp. NPDC051319 TaxID=3155047 RepID=UPI0034428302
MDDGLRKALLGIAANPSAPPDVLLRLTVLRATAEHLAWRQKNLPDIVVDALLALENSTVALALDGPRQPGAIRRRIAEHPNVEIRGAWRRFTEGMINVGNRVMPDDLAEYAGPDGLAGLARHADPVLRTAVAMTWDTMPVALRRDLLTDPDPRVRTAAAGHPHHSAPDDLHARLLADEATRKKAAAYATLTPQAIRECLAGDEGVRANLAANPTLPAQARDQLAADAHPYVRACLLLRQDLPEDHRRQLYAELVAESDRSFDEAGIALWVIRQDQPSWLRSLDLAERIAHLDSPIPCFRLCAADSPDLPPEVVRRLHTHEDVDVRRVVARRDDTPPEVLERLVTEHGEVWHRRPLIVEHPNFPPAAFIRLAANESPRRRVIAVHGPDLPADVVAALAADPIASVRAGAARHRNIPVAAWETLLADDDPEVVEAAGANPALPVELMRDLLDRAGL